MPGDDRLDGRRTTSLCQVDALASFRCAAVDLRAHPLAAILLATDGFSNAQAEPDWPQPVGAGLVAHIREHGVGGARERLGAGAAQCASAEGSGDDTTLALLLPGRPGQ